MSRLDTLTACLTNGAPVRAIGRIAAIDRTGLRVTGLDGIAVMGDRVLAGGRPGRIVAMAGAEVTIGLDDLTGLSISEPVVHLGPDRIAPSPDCLGRVIDASGRSLDGRPLLPGPKAVALASLAPGFARAGVSAPFVTGTAAIDLLSPLTTGACIRLRSEHGIGVTPFVARLAERGSPDVVVWSTCGCAADASRLTSRIGVAALAKTVVVLGPEAELGRGARAALAVAIDFASDGHLVALVAERAVSVRDPGVDRLRTIAESHGIIVVAVERVTGDAVLDPATDDRFDATFLATADAARAGLMPPIHPQDDGSMRDDVRSVAARMLSRQIRRGESGGVLDLLRETQAERRSDPGDQARRLEECVAAMVRSAEAPSAEATTPRFP